MRSVLLIAITAMLCVLGGATCVPLIDLDQKPAPNPTTELGASVTNPFADISVARGDVVPIEWTAVNLTGRQAVATVLVRSRIDFTDSIVAGGVLVNDTGTLQTVDWDTTAFSGEYSVIVRMQVGELEAESSATGRVTVNVPPTFEFTAPTEDVTFGEEEGTDPDPDPNDPNAPDPNDGGDDTARLTIQWSALDPDGDGEVSIQLDSDDDHDSGNEIELETRAAPTSEGIDTLLWDGTDAGGADVDEGTYNLFAEVSDPINGSSFIESGVRVTVPERPEPTELAIVEPADDVELLTTDDEPLTVEYTLGEETDDVLVDIKIDTDDNAASGNEQTILSGRLIEVGTTEDSFDWDGTLSNGDPAEDGIYRLYLVVTRSEGDPETQLADGLVFLRSVEDKPLIAITEPTDDVTVDAGDFVTIRWRDDDPVGEATIRLTVDDDRFPDEPVETDEPEIEILADRAADGDGALDTFSYQVPGTLDAGTYFIFAYIAEEGEPEQVSVASGRIVVEDPTGGN